jgi:hypothetical protein
MAEGHTTGCVCHLQIVPLKPETRRCQQWCTRPTTRSLGAAVDHLGCALDFLLRMQALRPTCLASALGEHWNKSMMDGLEAVLWDALCAVGRWG